MHSVPEIFVPSFFLFFFLRVAALLPGLYRKCATDFGAAAGAAYKDSWFERFLTREMVSLFTDLSMLARRPSQPRVIWRLLKIIQKLYYRTQHERGGWKGLALPSQDPCEKYGRSKSRKAFRTEVTEVS